MLAHKLILFLVSARQNIWATLTDKAIKWCPLPEIWVKMEDARAHRTNSKVTNYRLTKRTSLKGSVSFILFRIIPSR